MKPGDWPQSQNQCHSHVKWNIRWVKYFIFGNRCYGLQQFMPTSSSNRSRDIETQNIQDQLDKIDKHDRTAPLRDDWKSLSNVRLTNCRYPWVQETCNPRVHPYRFFFQVENVSSSDCIWAISSDWKFGSTASARRSTMQTKQSLDTNITYPYILYSTTTRVHPPLFAKHDCTSDCTKKKECTWTSNRELFRQNLCSLGLDRRPVKLR